MSAGQTTFQPEFRYNCQKTIPKPFGTNSVKRSSGLQTFESSFSELFKLLKLQTSQIK